MCMIPNLFHLAIFGQNTEKRKCPILQYVLLFTHCLLFCTKIKTALICHITWLVSISLQLPSKQVCHWDCTSVNISFRYKFRMHSPLFYHSKMWSCLWQQVMHCAMESKMWYQCRSVRILLLICKPICIWCNTDNSSSAHLHFSGEINSMFSKERIIPLREGGGEIMQGCLHWRVL